MNHERLRHTCCTFLATVTVARDRRCVEPPRGWGLAVCRTTNAKALSSSLLGIEATADRCSDPAPRFGKGPKRFETPTKKQLTCESLAPMSAVEDAGAAPAADGSSSSAPPNPKIIDLITPGTADGTPFISLEYFPPRTDEGVKVSACASLKRPRPAWRDEALGGQERNEVSLASGVHRRAHWCFACRLPPSRY
jgi:hypothetical protein